MLSLWKQTVFFFEVFIFLCAYLWWLAHLLEGFHSQKCWKRRISSVLPFPRGCPCHFSCDERFTPNQSAGPIQAPFLQLLLSQGLTSSEKTPRRASWGYTDLSHDPFIYTSNLRFIITSSVGLISPWWFHLGWGNNQLHVVIKSTAVKRPRRSGAYGAFRYHPCLIIQMINHGWVVLISWPPYGQMWRVCACAWAASVWQKEWDESGEAHMAFTSCWVFLIFFYKNIISVFGIRKDDANISLRRLIVSFKKSPLEKNYSWFFSPLLFKRVCYFESGLSDE